MKDNFSAQANAYAQFRPEYPQALFDFILDQAGEKKLVWDCATGNGQAAKVLCKHFEHVEATDISQKQLDHAHKAPNITYTLQAAEKTTFPAQYFDLITVAQAVHWFDFDAFFREAARVLKPGGCLAVWGYGTINLADDALDRALQHFYRHTIGRYWDAERRHIDEHYANIPFPWPLIPTPVFRLQFDWQRETLEGYLNTWSAVQHFIRANGVNPVTAFMQDLASYWHESDLKAVQFDIFLKIMKILPHPHNENTTAHR